MNSRLKVFILDLIYKKAALEVEIHENTQRNKNLNLQVSNIDILLEDLKTKYKDVWEDLKNDN